MGAVLGRQIAEAAVITQAQTGGGQELLVRVVDDWCGTRGPHPWPPGWPHLVDPDPHPWFVAGPDRSPWNVAQMFASASIVFARYSSGLEDGDLRDGFRGASDKAGERAGGGAQRQGLIVVSRGGPGPRAPRGGWRRR